VNNVTDKTSGSTPGDQVYTGDLQPGQWVTRPDIAGESPIFVLFRSDPDASGSVVVVFKGTYSFSETLSANLVFRIATPERVAAFKDSVRRLQIAERLRTLAGLIESHSTLPLGTYPSISFESGLSKDDLERVAAIVGVEVSRPYGDRREVVFGSYETFRAEWSGKWDDEPDEVDEALDRQAKVRAADDERAAKTAKGDAEKIVAESGATTTIAAGEIKTVAVKGRSKPTASRTARPAGADQ
jgi:hypothetical protein